MQSLFTRPGGGLGCPPPYPRGAGRRSHPLRATEDDAPNAPAPPSSSASPSQPDAPASDEPTTPAAARRRVAGRRGGGQAKGRKAGATLDDFNPMAMGRKSR
jgi:hypothetical protein